MMPCADTCGTRTFTLLLPLTNSTISRWLWKASCSCRVISASLMGKVSCPGRDAELAGRKVNKGRRDKVRLMVLVVERKTGKKANLVFVPKQEFLRFYEEHITRNSRTELTVLAEFNPDRKDWDAEPSYERILNVFMLSIQEQHSIKTDPGITRDFRLPLSKKFKDILKARSYHPQTGFLKLPGNACFRITIERRKENFSLYVGPDELILIKEAINKKRAATGQEPLVYLITHIGLSY
jgi:hypothetical protein